MEGTLSRIWLAVKVLLGLALVAVVGITTLLFARAPEFIHSRVNRVVRDTTVTVSDETSAFHRTLFIADLHDDVLSWRYDINRRHEVGHSDVPRLLEGGVDLHVFSAITKTLMNSGERNDDRSSVTDIQSILQTQPLRTWFSPLGRALYQSDKLRRFAARSHGALTLITSRSEFEALLGKADDDRRVGALLSVEGLHALEGEISNFDRLYDAGYRIYGLAHFFDNPFAGSATGLERHGLTPLGRRLIARGDERGVIWDLAHASDATITDVLETASGPVIVTHTGVRALCDRERNLSDEQLLRIAARGGLIGVGLWEGDGPACAPDIEGIARTVRHVAALVGVEHVALGSDFNGGVTTPFDAAGLPRLTQALLDSGLTRDEVRAIMGENVRRLLLASLR